MNKKIAVLSGDGIGPEVTHQAVQVLESVADRFGHQFIFEEALIGACAIDQTGDPFPQDTEQVCRNADAILFGAIGHPKYDNDPSAKVRPEQGLLAMRKKLGLYANVRPVTSYEALEDKSPLKNEIVHGTDFVVFRELTGGIYFGEPRGRTENGATAFDTCVYSRHEIERIAHQAFQAAQKRGKHLTLVDKANVLATSRLWREVVKSMAAGYPDVELDFMFVDNAAMKIILNPGFFDVILTENMFGDIITDEASVLAGSLGMLPSASTGDSYALYEPIHGSYPEAAGKNIANPVGAILSAAMLLEYSFDMLEESAAIREAVAASITEGIVTSDIDASSTYGTTEVGAHIISLLKSSVSLKS
ncbi:3-isopropylmalate dehydrogenase [Fulvivirga sedimenti]|uniref:3-isopropylmalate dehydrogenase n=1 Tax=Fulvivirga sedimenti TaxID=2879465 RepID=A0A9X1HP97_9BACT|nr:3-isopropylmalate dehydrogenase [Fulvivirga sedimenti]MCA6075471.1 3-isopropylmalate dehydrogenase [Fulvivirga sedimenti]MCA6076648.1 3-isopropylmalate dehydrogenase [Fulvivirga sedimenti]MCA6077776.1 3-isopropylmalate dehydrogenase [Fulvivirga sedimenti]